jgi:hypothetical protein
MTFQDLLVVERHVAELCSAAGCTSLPVMRPLDYDRVDIDVELWVRQPLDREALRAALSRRLADEGRLWDVWPAGETKLCVSAREEEEE